MKIFEETITLDDMNEPVKVIPFGDIHIGAAGVNITYLKNTIEWIRKTPNCYAIGMGDYCDCIDVKDKRFDIKLEKDIEQLQIQLCFVQEENITKKQVKIY